ncbi:peptide deformylase [Obelidium mucronatum]|nr:peptide deformylase [Obelidium mucronatum]
MDIFPQVGHPLRIIAYKIGDAQTIKAKKATASPLTFLINPTLEILERESKWEAEYESCESMPHYNCLVKRPSKVLVEALDVKGEKIRFTADGFLAKVLHHEVDHLDGITLVDRALPKTLRHDQYIELFENYPSK